jgi:hypothetical protein
MPSRCWRSWLERSPVTRWPGRLKRHVFACVHVQQVAGALPLVAIGLPTRRPRRPRDPGPPQHLPNRGVTEAGRATDQTRPPAGLASTGTDRPGELGRELPRAARAIKKTGERRPRLLARLKPAVPPTVRRRRRHAETGCSLLQRHPALEARSGQPVRASRYGGTTSEPSFGAGLWRDPQPRRRAG